MVTLKKKFHSLKNNVIDLPTWLSHLNHYTYLKDVSLITRAAKLASESSKGLTTFYGQPYIEQGLSMADILLDMRLDQDSIAAAIITSTAQHTTIPIETIEEKLGASVAKLVQSVLKINVLNNLQSKGPRSKTQLDRLRKIFLAMVSDIRVVLIKLAERTCMMRGIKNINPVERKRLAEETMDIYAPLANRLGIGQLKWELEDAAFHYIDPETYKTIANFIAERRIDREQRIQEIIQKLENALAKVNIKPKITGRAKHIYSIYLKMLRKHVDYKNIYDYSAVRILVPDIQHCYTALSVAHSLFEHIPEEFDDYIANPKANGYRSIHTAVIGTDGKPLEIQIRTHDMHEEAEHGVAAHWIYKEHTPQSGYEAKITYLRQLLAWHKDLAKQNDASQLPEEFLEDTVYVLTPAGEVIDLPSGSTPLDFAYHIHSELGHRCRGAKIKGHIVPLTYQLKTGDQVEIITAAQGKPSRDWLSKDGGYLRTARARSKVVHWFKQQENESSVESAKTTVQREHPRPASVSSETDKQIFLSTKPVKESHSGLEIAGINDLLTRIARCCKPIPGDQVIGYITQGRGISIHRQDCNNIATNCSRDANRMIQVAWDTKKLGNYYVDLKIRANGQQELLKEITSLLANAKIDLMTLNSTVSKKSNMIYIVMTIQIHDLLELKNIINQIQHLPKIIDVKRISE